MSETIKKLEKIASALYLITSFFDDKEPLKWRLRTLSNDLVVEGIKDKSSISRDVLALFSVAKNAGLVSETNYNIVVQELSKLGDKLRDEPIKPLDLAFLREINIEEKSLPEPQKNYYIKDKTVEKPALKEFGAVSVKKNSRQNIIINLIKRKKEIMIKDVSPLVSDCSEKTIQRELLAMVRANILKKTGEKRWSRYSLA